MVESRQQKRQRVRIVWTNDQGQSFFFSLDAAVELRHQISAVVTEHPIERGKNATDHIRPNPAQVSIQGGITNTPIVLPADGTEGARAVEVLVEQPPLTVGNTIGRPIPIVGALTNKIKLPIKRKKAVVLGFDPGFDRVGFVFSALEKLNADGSLVTIVTKLKTYQNMALESVEVSQSAEIGDAIELSIQAKEILIGATRNVEVPSLPTKRAARGNKPTKPVAAVDEDDEQESVLHMLAGDD